QDKYVAEILRKFRLTKVKTASTPMETQKPLLKYGDGVEVDVHMYRDCNEKKLIQIVKIDIDKNVAGKAKKIVRLMMKKLFDMELELLRLFWSTVMAKTINGEVQIHARVYGKKIVITKSSIRRDLQLADEEGIDYLSNSTIFEQLALMDKPKIKDTQVPQPSGPTESVVDEAVNKERDDRLVRATTTASSVEAKQDSGNITNTQSKETPIESSSLGTTSGGGPRVLDLKKTKTTQKKRLIAWKRKVKKLKKRNGLRTHKLKRLYMVGLTANDEVIMTVDEVTLAQVLMEIKSIKPKAKVIVFQEPCESTTTIISSKPSHDKVTSARLAREKVKQEKRANIALIETWDDIQVKINDDHQLAEILQAQEQEELSDAEKATLFQQLLEKRRKHFAAKRAEKKRNKPPTQAQQRKIMCTYLKNMKGYKLKDLKLKEFDTIQQMFEKAFRRQKLDDDKEITELKQLMKIIPDDEEVAIDAISLAVKSPRIVDCKIHKEGKKSYYQIVRADGKSKMYMVFSQMLKEFNMEDLEDLYKLVKARCRSTRQVEDLDFLLWGDLKIMFDPHVEDEI
nr:hypothetical protein [Tanacetum cinerariifolium]